MYIHEWSKVLSDLLSMHVVWVFVRKCVFLVGTSAKFVARLVGENLFFHLSENEFNVIVSFDCSLVIFIHKNILYQVVQDLQLLWGKFELWNMLSFLVSSRISFSSCLEVLLESFKQEIKSSILAILDQASLDDGVVGDIVWSDTFWKHQVVHLKSLINSESLKAGLNHACVHKNACFNSLWLHLL